MSIARIDESLLTDIADAIRSKNGSSDTYTPAEMAEAIDDLDAGGITPTGTIQISANGTFNVTNYASAEVNVSGGSTISLQAKSATPSETAQTITPDSNYDGLSQVSVGAISSTYVGSGVSRQAAKTVTPSTSSQTAVAANTYTTGAVTVSAMPSGTAGTPTATKGSVSNHSISVTPSVTNTSGYITGSTKTGTSVSVSASELVSGTLNVTNNGTQDVTNYASIDVNVSGGGSAKNIQVYSGTANRKANSYGATSVSLTVAKTGTYKITWCAARGSSSGTMGTNLHIGNTAETTNHTTWTGTYWQHIELTNVSLTAGQVLTLYATSGSTSRTIYVGNLIIEEQ